MPKMVRLWSHEVMRVFHDRLINEEDGRWFCSLIKNVITSGFKLRLEDIFDKSRLQEVLSQK